MIDTWWHRRAVRSATRWHTSSVYLVPALLVLDVCGVRAFAPMAPALLAIGTLTSYLVVRWNHDVSWMRLVASVVGHGVLVVVPYAFGRTAFPRVSLAPSLALFAVVVAFYRACDAWPYTLTPCEFVALAVVGVTFGTAASRVIDGTIDGA